MFHVEQMPEKKRKPASPRLTRRQIKDGLDSMPIDTLLLGSGKGDTLTHKQREFARLVALGETKTGAYRTAYNSKGKPEGQSVAGCRLAQDPRVSLMIEAYQLANEAAKYRTPAQLRELVIHQLTQHALDDDINAAQRIKALELLGKVSEVAAFTERKETTVVKQSSDIKAKLLESLRNVVDVDARSVDDDADSLLAELSNPKVSAEGDNAALENVPPVENVPLDQSLDRSVENVPVSDTVVNVPDTAPVAEMGEVEPYPTPTPLNEPDGGRLYIHTTPHKQIQPESTKQAKPAPPSNNTTDNSNHSQNDDDE